MLTVPAKFAEATISREGAAGRAWIDGLPALAARFLDEWSCTPAGPVQHGFIGVVLPVRRTDGSDAVLKLSFPHQANVAQPVVLAAWRGRGAVRLLERDDAEFAMLLTLLHPLITRPATPFTAVGRLAHRLAVAAPATVPTLSEKVHGWIADLPVHSARLGNPLGRRVVETALANARDLAADYPDVLVHGDLHFGNIMRDDQDRLVAIDPSGLVGDPAFDLLPLLRGEWPTDLDRAIAEFAEAAEVDRDRVRRWAQARATEETHWSRGLGEPAWVTQVCDDIATRLA